MFNRFFSSLFSGSEKPVQYTNAQVSDIQRLFAAAKDGNLPVISTITNFFRDLDVRDERGNTPLIMAASQNQTAAARVLINNGAAVDARGENGFTALHVAAYFGHLDVATMLISRGANIENRTNPEPGCVGGSATPLWSAVRNGHENMVRLLIAADANVNAVDGESNPLLVYAVSRGNAQIVQMLRQVGANPSLFATNGHNAISLASVSGRQDMLQSLLDEQAVPVLKGNEIPEPADDVVMGAREEDEVVPGGLPGQQQEIKIIDQPVNVAEGLDQEVRARRRQYFAKNGMFAAAARGEAGRTNNPQRVSRAR